MKTQLIKTKIIAAVGVLLLATASCSDYLDVVPDNVAVMDDAFKTRDNAERFLNTLYGHLPNFSSTGANPALSLGDETYVGIPGSVNYAQNIVKTGGQTVNNVHFSYWGRPQSRNLFIALRDCNIFMDNLDTPYDLKEGEKNRWIAEAKFLKAYYHFWLMRMYGPIPIIKRNIEVNEGPEAVKAVRQPVDEVTAYIVQLLDEAMPDLPLTIENTGAELGRASKTIALGLKARVLVTAASPLFNGNQDYAGFTNAEGKPLISTEYNAQKWEDAVLACKQAIDTAAASGHELYEFGDALKGWSDVTITRLSIRGALTERWNKEVIWGASGRPVSGLQWLSQAVLDPNVRGNNLNSTSPNLSVTLRIAELFYSENGVPIDEDKNYDYANRYQTKEATNSDLYRIQPGYETAKLHFNREPRFYASLGFDGGKWIGHGVRDDRAMYHVEAKIGQFSGNGDPNRANYTGYFPKKYVYYKNVQAATAFSYSTTTYPFPVIRLADLYLLYAEALNETGQTAQALPWIDRVRARAGLQGVAESWSQFSRIANKPNTQEGLRDIIHDERMIELVFEGHRFWDVRRWKRGIELFNGTLRGWDMFAVDTEDFYNIQDLIDIKFQQRDYLWPIAEQDIIGNDKLIQNPGW